MFVLNEFFAVCVSALFLESDAKDDGMISRPNHTSDDRLRVEITACEMFRKQRY
jgi:hypothetical protein